MEHDGQNCVILDCFLPFYHPNNPKNQNFEKMKKHLEILSFYKCAPEMIIIRCMVLEIWSVTENFFLSFWTAFGPSTTRRTRKIKILKE